MSLFSRESGICGRGGGFRSRLLGMIRKPKLDLSILEASSTVTRHATYGGNISLTIRSTRSVKRNISAGERY
eukprot:980088-Amorphochlora_amoeboformis.AAC.1